MESYEPEETVDPGYTASVELLIETYPDYRYKNAWPEEGGTLDQDPFLWDAFRECNNVVEWYKINEKKRDNLPDMVSHFARRRARFKGGH